VVDFAGNESPAFAGDPGFLYDTLAPQVNLKGFSKFFNAGNDTQKQRIEFNVFDPFSLQLSGSGIDPNSISISNIEVKDPKGNPVTLSNFSIDTFGNVAVEIDPAQFPSGTWKNADQGSYIITLNGIQDRVGNGSGEFNLGSFEVGTSAPAPTLTATPVPFTDVICQVTFSFDITPGVEITILELSQILVNGPAQLSHLQKVGTNLFTVDVSPTETNAFVDLRINAGSVRDRLNNGGVVGCGVRQIGLIINEIRPQAGGHNP